MSIVRTIHGELRWVIAIVAIIVLVKFAIGWLGKREYQSIDRTLLVVFTSLLDINLLLGLVLLFTMGISGAARLEHAVTMILAVIAAHLTALWRNLDDSTIKYRNQFLMVLVSVILLILGVMRIRMALYGLGFF
ncbi:MAG: hypothetical protein R3C44_06790 [Chloroflexota bacterium]